MSEIEILRRRAITFPMFPVDGTLDEQETFITKIINSILKVRQVQRDYEERIKKHSTKKISIEHVPHAVHISVKCQAINMNNTQCKFKATCGKFCKKHQISKKDLDLI